MVKIRLAYSTSLPVLMKIMAGTNGDVCELGAGIFSTPLLHWLCVPRHRHLVSYETDVRYMNMFNLQAFAHEYHQVRLVENYDQAELERAWDMVYIDHGPAERRKVDAARVANYAKFVVLHDSDGRLEKAYHYSEIYPLFKYLYTWMGARPHTTILSNFVDLKGFMA